MASDEREYDMVIFGASGFTGKYVVEELARTGQLEIPGLRWAIAGRSMAKLQTVLADVGSMTGESCDRGWR